MGATTNKIELFSIKEIDHGMLKHQFSAKFVYNYFEKTENEDPLPQYKNDLNGRPLEIIPRYIEIDFSRANSLNYSGIISEQFKEKLNDDDISLETIVDGARDESRISSLGFLGVDFIDRNTSSHFYDLSDYIRATTEKTDIKLSTNANILEKIYDASSSVASGNEEAIITSMITDTDFNQPTQLSSELQDKAALHSGVFNKINSIKIKSFINEMYTSRVLSKIAKSRTSPYADEMSKMLEILPHITNVNSDETTEGYFDFEHVIPPASSTVLNSHNAEVIGYIIEKHENVMTGDSEFDRNNKIIHKPIYIKGTSSTKIIDRNVKYGGSYEYVVKTVVGFTKYALIEQNGTSDWIRTLKIYVSSGSSARSVLCSERIPPLPPENVTYRYNFKKDAMMLLWDFPFNKQQDIKRFQIYRRLSLESPFELLREIDFDDSTIRSDLTAASGNKNNVRRQTSTLCCFYDTDFNIESKYIYAVAALDARGLTSGYSSQFFVSYDRFKNKTNATFISKEGAPKPYPNIFLEIDALPDAITVSRKNKINVYFDPECKDVWMTKDGNTSYEKVFLKYNDAEPASQEGKYIFQIINIDSQESENVEISIKESEYKSEEEILAEIYQNHGSGNS